MKPYTRLNADEVAALRLLAEVPPGAHLLAHATVTDLAAASGLDMAAAWRFATELEDSALLRKTRDGAGTWRLAATSLGREVLGRLS